MRSRQKHGKSTSDLKLRLTPGINAIGGMPSTTHPIGRMLKLTERAKFIRVSETHSRRRQIEPNRQAVARMAFAKCHHLD
jgi:hypothetical protein